MLGITPNLSACTVGSIESLLHTRVLERVEYQRTVSAVLPLASEVPCFNRSAILLV